MRTRTLLINHVQGTVKAMGYHVPSSTARTFALRARSALPPALAPALANVVDTIAHRTEQIAAADRAIALLARDRYPEAARLRQIAGVGPITALCFALTLEDPTRFAESRSVGAYLGLCPRESQSGAHAPQLRITKAGDPMLRVLQSRAAALDPGLSQPGDVRAPPRGLNHCLLEWGKVRLVHRRAPC